ncbi:uracil phosphoribosyltransferase-domain-containing protein [Achaetomium macrosporum]|uniref:Uracil phosphoribosyltransferase-domain-containing protein n=1 Tax=Achaetomium macrosporum TaxID=79813 RepID=A0AAN7C2T0_9PEZI|nr:uracil phosphoribosyltransferase-domain-containing protein [Achaetomium macrosporum]
MASTKPVVIGLYGVPGCGKSTVMRDLKHSLVATRKFSFHEGSDMIASLVPGGLAEFKTASDEAKAHWRQAAIEAIAELSRSSGRAAVVTGHFMFWNEGDKAGEAVYTQGDLDTYTHIVYLDPAPELVVQWRQNDGSRDRPLVSAEHLRRWQQTEKAELRRLCRNSGILFLSVSDTKSVVDRMAALLVDFEEHTEARNLSEAKNVLEEILNSRDAEALQGLETTLVLDGDRTLAPVDTGPLFWNLAANWEPASPKGVTPVEDDRSLKALFSSPLGYSYTAFRQATLLYEEHIPSDDDFNRICDEVASSVKLYPGMVSLLKHVEKHSHHIAVIVVTCGLRRVWEAVLDRAGLSNTVKVIGGGRLSDGLIVTAEVKAALVAFLRDTYALYVTAVGDSPLDVPMMREAHQAVVVVGEEHGRSKTMDERLRQAIDQGGLRARQVLLPSSAPPRLDPGRLPVVHLADAELLASIVDPRYHYDRILHATARNAAKLLMTPTRDARVAGPALRRAHARVGWYLATELLPEVLGTEEYSIPHVQGHTTSGHRILNEEKTTIVALMRGGEPMALGVNDALPGAMFLHAKKPDEVKAEHVKGQWAILLVDSVVNSGKSMVEFVQRIRSLDATVPIVCVAGVVQARSISCFGDGLLNQALQDDKALSLVALRLSDNKFTGQGGTDTGNRLFNTTRLD